MRRKFFVGMALLGLLLLLVGYVALYTNFGLRSVLRVAGAKLPGTLRTETVVGRLAGPLELTGLTWDSPDFDLEVERLRLDWRPLKLLNGTVELSELTASGLELSLPERAAAGGTETGPAPISTDWVVRLRRGQVDRLRIVGAAGEPIELSGIELNAELAAGVVTADIAATDRRGDWSATGRIDTRRDYRHRVLLGLRPAGDEQAIELRSEGDLAKLTIVAEAPAFSARVDATVTTPLEALHWQAQAAARLPGVERLTATGTGTLSEATLSIDLVTGGYEVHAEPVRLDWLAGRLRVRESTLEIPGIAQWVEFNGSFTLAAEPSFEVAMEWMADTAHPPLADYLEAARGTLNVAGTVAEARLDGTATLATPGGPVELTFDGGGDRHGIDPLRLEATGEAGELRLLGAVSWNDGLGWRFDLDGTGLDPGAVFPEWPAKLDLRGASVGRAGGGVIEASLELDSVGGTFRARPVSGTASARVSNAGLESVAADLVLGRNRIEARGQWAQRREGEARLRIVDLGELLPGAAGALESSLSLSDGADGVALQTSGSGSELSWRDFKVQTLTFSGDSPDALGSLRNFELDLIGLSYGGAVLDAVGVSAAGPWRALGLNGRIAAGELGEVVLAANLDALGGGSGRIDRLDWNSAQYGAWKLRAPAGYRTDAGRLDLEPLCLDRRPGLICVTVDAAPDDQALKVELEALPAELAQLPLSIALERPLRLAGEVSGRLEAALEDDMLERLAGDLEVRDASLSLDFGRGWQSLSLGLIRASLNGDGARIEGSASAESDLFSASLVAALDDPLGLPQSPLEARFEADVPDLGPLIPILGLPVTLEGRAAANLDVSGTAAEPEIAGRVSVSEVVFEAAAYGSRWRNGRLDAAFDGDGNASLTGSIDAEQGRIEIEGQGDYATAQASLRLRGDGVQVANTPTLELEISPDLELTASASGYRLQGTVEVVNAKVEEFEVTQSVPPSPDVIVVDEPREAAAPALPLTTDVRVRFRNPAELLGYGMTAELSGELRVVDEPDEPTLATGELRLGGSYEAYGQDLTIDEGRLIYAQTPLDNPSIRANAYREVGSVRAGVRISGRAAEPKLTLYSEPSMGDTEILSYLILGRPPSGGGDLDGSEMVTNAALQLGLSQGNNVVGQVGSKLGFDQLAIAVDEEFGGAAVSIGRYLSPRLYLSYSTGLVQAIDLLRFEYRLSRKWTIQSEIGIQTRTTLSYELETGRPKVDGGD